MEPLDGTETKYLAQFGGAGTQEGHLASQVPGEHAEGAGVPAEGRDQLSAVLPGHADLLRPAAPLQLELPHHHQTLAEQQQTNTQTQTNTTAMTWALRLLVGR